MAKHIVLLTSTIQPKPNQPGLKLVDPTERLNDYKTAFAFYADLLEKGVLDHIVYVDNSGYDLSELSTTFTHSNIEWIGFYGLDYPSTYHRGYGEFKLIDHAFTHSRVLTELAEDSKVWKVTGRYIIQNLARMIQFCPVNFDIYCNTRKNWVDMEVLAWSKAGYQSFIQNIWQLFATGKAPELILSDVLNENQNDTLRIVKRFFWSPVIIGRRGTDGGNFQGRFTRYKGMLKASKNAVLLPCKYLMNVIR